MLSAWSLMVAIACVAAIAQPGEDAALAGLDVSRIVAVAMEILKRFFYINLILAFFNMIPIPPLDGSWVMEHLYPRSLGPFYARIRPYGMLSFIGFYYFDAFSYLLAPVAILLGNAFRLMWVYAIL